MNKIKVLILVIFSSLFFIGCASTSIEPEYNPDLFRTSNDINGTVITHVYFQNDNHVFHNMLLPDYQMTVEIKIINENPVLVCTYMGMDIAVPYGVKFIDKKNGDIVEIRSTQTNDCKDIFGISVEVMYANIDEKTVEALKTILQNKPKIEFEIVVGGILDGQMSIPSKMNKAMQEILNYKECGYQAPTE